MYITLEQAMVQMYASGHMADIKISSGYLKRPVTQVKQRPHRLQVHLRVQNQARQHRVQDCQQESPVNIK